MNIKVLLRVPGKFFSFLVFGSLLVVCFTKSFAQPDANLSMISTAREYEQLQENLHHLASEDAEKRLTAIHYLKSFIHYFEVKEAFLEALLTEIDQSSPKIRSMSMIITAVEPFLSSQDTFTLVQLREQIKTHPALSSVSLDFSIIINRAISKDPNGIESYTLSDMQDNKEHHTLLTTQLYSLFSKSTNGRVKRGIRTFRRGSIQFLSDHWFFEEPYSQLYQDEAHQVIGALSQNNSIPILIGSRNHNQTVIRTITALSRNTSGTFSNARRGVYVVETAPSRINKIETDFVSDFTKARNLKDYLEAILDIERRLQIRIIIFMDKFHRLSASQRAVLSSYLQRRRPIQLVAASSREGYQRMSKDLFNFKEVTASEISKQDLKNTLKNSILPNLRENWFTFEISEVAIDNIVDYVHQYHYNNEPLVVITRRLISELLSRKRQRAPLQQNLEVYHEPVQITDEEISQFLHIQAIRMRQSDACRERLM